jgi:hypothetical protein
LNQRRIGRRTPFTRTALGAALFVLSAGAAMGQTYSFSTCGQAGATGPSQGQCTTAYAATSLDGTVTVTGGIQAWTVPTTGSYAIVANGAQGARRSTHPGFPAASAPRRAGCFP